MRQPRPIEADLFTVGDDVAGSVGSPAGAESRRAWSPAELAAALDLFVDLLADRIAARLMIVDEREIEVDQDHLPSGIGRRAYLEAVRRGEIPAWKIGRRVIAKLADLRTWVAGRAVAVRSKAPTSDEDEEKELEEIARANGFTIRK